ncbi:MAG: glycerophosphodiester phosphodiesterase family protein [Ketobacteraceae bacterium]|nr:glycerophosphodiester phosphodiesterase family protein [Ketobacteraceae bacterium]
MYIIGHRGAKNEAPENTMQGFQHLRAMGIHRVELDVRLSKDKQLVVLHDTTLDRTTDQKGKLIDYTAEQLASLNAGQRFRSKSPNIARNTHPFSGVPTLDQVIKEWPELQSIQLEVKSTDLNSLEMIAERINFVVDAHQIARRVCITSSDTAFLRIIARRFRHLKRGYVAERFMRDPISVCMNLDCKILVINWRKCTKALIDRAHAHGLEVSVWTVNRLDIALRLYEWGIDSLITDEPTAMLRTFKFIHHSHHDPIH